MNMKTINSCCVPNCLSISGSRTRQTDYIFHKFPTSDRMRQEWLKKIGIQVENLRECDAFKVCQKHFRRHHQVKGTNDLHPWAIPSLQLDDPKLPAETAVGGGKVPRHKPNLIRAPKRVVDRPNFIATNNRDDDDAAAAAVSLPNTILEAIDPLEITNVLLVVEPNGEEAESATVETPDDHVIEILEDDLDGELLAQPTEAVQLAVLIDDRGEVEPPECPADTGEFTVVTPPTPPAAAAAAAVSPPEQQSQLRQLLTNPVKRGDRSDDGDEKLTHLLLVHKRKDIDVQIARDYRDNIFTSIEHANPDCTAITEFMTARRLYHKQEGDKQLQLTYGGIDGSRNARKIEVRSSPAPETSTSTTQRFNDSCRVCLQPRGAANLKNIKTETVEACPADEILHQMTKQFTAGIDQSQFPTNICTQCLRDMRQSYRFIMQVERSYRTLRSYLSSASTASDSATGGGVETNDVPQTCLKCMKHFDNFTLLQNHSCPFRFDLKTSRILPGDDYCCKFCHHRFTYFLNLCRHICDAPRTTLSKPIQCKHCDKKFATKSLYAKHRELKNHQIRNFCYDCDICFDTRVRYATHRTVFLHVDEQVCKFCGEHVKNDQIIRHLGRHRTRYTCRQCDEHSWSIDDYKEHLKSHIRDLSDKNGRYSKKSSDQTQSILEKQFNINDIIRHQNRKEPVQKPPKTFSKTVQTISIPPNPFQYTPRPKIGPSSPAIKQTKASISQNVAEIGGNAPRLGQNVVKMGQNVVKMGQNVVKMGQNLNTKGQNLNTVGQSTKLGQNNTRKRDIRKLGFYDIEQHIIKFGQNTQNGQNLKTTTNNPNKSGQTQKLSQSIDKPQVNVLKPGQTNVNQGQNNVNVGQNVKIGQNCLKLAQNVTRSSQNVSDTQRNEAKLGQNIVTDQKVCTTGQKRQIGQVLDEISSPSTVKIARIDNSTLKTVQYLNKTGQNPSKSQNTPVPGQKTVVIQKLSTRNHNTFTYIPETGQNQTKSTENISGLEQTSSKTGQFIAKPDKNILKIGQTKKLVIIKPTANITSPGVGQNKDKSIKFIFNPDNVTKISKILTTLNNST